MRAVCSLRFILMTLITVSAGCSVGHAQNTFETESLRLSHTQFSGVQQANILNAWRAIQEELHPVAELSDFEISYIETARSITISFFRPNTITELSQGDILIRQDSLYIQVAIVDSQIHVLPIGSEFIPQQ